MAPVFLIFAWNVTGNLRRNCWHLACSTGRVRSRLPIPVAFFLTSFDPGGTEHQMTELVCRLDPGVFDVHVAVHRTGGVLQARLESAGIPVTDFPIRSVTSPAALRQMLHFAEWCTGNGIQAVQACDYGANVFALPGAALAGVPVRFGSRRDVFMPERTPGQRRLQRLSYLLAHRIIGNSAAAVEQLIEEGVADWRIVQIANGLDVSRFPPRQPRPRLRVVTTVANLRPGKGHEVLLEAAARVVRRVPDVHFQIVGDGPRRAELEQQAAALRISAQVSFLGHSSDVPAVLQQTDVFAFPSFMEASPNAVMEAMAAGLPVVATRVGGIPEVIEDGRSGVLVPPHDDRALAAGILRLIARPDLAARMGEAARQTVEARFSFERMVGEFQQLYLHELSARVAPEVLTWAESSGN
jgi:glycosyltransferase involved in cell wall biosynthesis